MDPLAPDENCGTCRFGLPRHATAELMALAAAAGHPVPPLHCRRFPQAVPKQPHEWCGEWGARPAAKPEGKSR